MQQPDVTPQLNLWKDFKESFTLLNGIRILYEHLSTIFTSELITWNSEKRYHFADITNVMTLNMIAMYHLYQPLSEANLAGVQLADTTNELKEYIQNFQELNQAFGKKSLEEYLDEYITLFIDGFDNYTEQMKLITVGSERKTNFYNREKEEVLYTVKQIRNLFLAAIDIDLALLPEDIIG